MIREKFYTEQLEDGWSWVETYLDDWKRWMRDPGLELDGPRRASGVIAGGWGGYRNISDQWEGEARSRATGLINACLDDMAPAESCAVHHVKLHAVFRFRFPVETLYQVARQKIGRKLMKNDFS